MRKKEYLKKIFLIVTILFVCFGITNSVKATVKWEGLIDCIDTYTRVKGSLSKWNVIRRYSDGNYRSYTVSLGKSTSITRFTQNRSVWYYYKETFKERRGNKDYYRRYKVYSDNYSVYAGIISKDVPVKVSQITLKTMRKTLNKGETFLLSYVVGPKEATNKQVIWKSSDSSIVSVSQIGIITAERRGTARISVEAEDGSGVKTYCDVTVRGDKDDVTNINLNYKTKQLAVGEKLQLKYSCEPKDVRVDYFYAKSSNPNVATVSSDLVVTAKKKGRTEVTVHIGSKTAKCIINVYDKVLSLNKTTADLKVGDTLTLKATISPESEKNKTITWKSGNESIATVTKDGIVKAKKIGKTTITATVGTQTRSCVINVVVPVNSVSFDKKSLYLRVGSKFNLVLTINPQNATNKTVTLKSSDTSIATVSSQSETVKVITAKKVGKTAITATVGGKVTSCIVEVSSKQSKDYYEDKNGKLKYVKDDKLITEWVGDIRYKNGEPYCYKDKDGKVKYSASGKKGKVVTMKIGNDFYKEGILVARKNTSNNKYYNVENGSVTRVLYSGWMGKTYYASGNLVKSDFRTIDGKKYYFDDKGTKIMDENSTTADIAYACTQYLKTHGYEYDSSYLKEARLNKEAGKKADCSSFVSWVLQMKGYKQFKKSDGKQFTSYDFENVASNMLANDKNNWKTLGQKNGWKAYTGSSYYEGKVKLKKGDIITYADHVEIYAGSGNYVYNIGATEHITGDQPRLSGHLQDGKRITYILRIP